MSRALRAHHHDDGEHPTDAKLDAVDIMGEFALRGPRLHRLDAEQTMKVTVRELEEACRQVARHLERENEECVDLDDIDLYRFISTDDWESFDSTDDPLVGSLHDDWTSLKRAVESDFLTPVDIERLAFVLRAIAHKLS